jgi:hypothetical protein
VRPCCPLAQLAQPFCSVSLALGAGCQHFRCLAVECPRPVSKSVCEIFPIKLLPWLTHSSPGHYPRCCCKCEMLAAKVSDQSWVHVRRLVLQSRRDGGAHAATMVFLLNSQPVVRSPLKRVRVEGPMYEMQQFDFTVNNPFNAGATCWAILMLLGVC